MKKILYVASNMRHINNFHIPYIEKLRAEGHTVKVMATGDGADYNIRFVKKLVSLKNLLMRRKIRRIIKRENFDCVILNTTLAAFCVRLALPKTKRPKVMNIVHGYLFSENDSGLKAKFLRYCEKHVREKTDVIVVMNEEDRRIATDNSLCLSEVIMTRGFGATVEKQLITLEHIRQYTDTVDKYMLCFVGELSERKNQRFLICSLPEIKIAIPKVKLVLVGDGDSERSLRALAQRIGVVESVCFVGQKSNPCDFMRAADLYVSASEIEGMPFNIIEALGAKAPILASDIKGHVDLIEDGEEGYLYERGNMADFAAKVKAFYKGDVNVDPQRQAEQYVKYSFDEVFPETYAVMRDFVK